MENLAEKRLWIGNLDPRINEYQLLKMLQKHGTIEKFDLLFYRNGPLAGQPRGYAFVTFTKQEEAETAKETLNNKLVGSKKIVVKWAHSINENNLGKEQPHLNIPVLTGPSKRNVKQLNRESQIQAIEAKLKYMKRDLSPEFEIKTPTPVTPPPHVYKNGESSQKSTRPIDHPKKQIKRK